MLKSWLCFLVVISSLVAIAQDFTDPVSYNNYILNEQSRIIGKSLEYTARAVHTDDFEIVEKERLELISEIEKSILTVRRMPPFKGRND